MRKKETVRKRRCKVLSNKFKGMEYGEEIIPKLILYCWDVICDNWGVLFEFYGLIFQNFRIWNINFEIKVKKLQF